MPNCPCVCGRCGCRDSSVIGAIAAAHRRFDPELAVPVLPWRLCGLPVCASTEAELDRLVRQSTPAPLAVIARRQTRGHGQAGRLWCSPPGGVWLSALLPWPGQFQGSASLALAVAVGLALQLEPLGLRPQIKWPNDLLLEGRKLAGVLPRLRWRGERILGAQVGLGINGCNRVPPEGISLAEALASRRPTPGASRRHHPEARPERLAARVLRALEWAVAAAGEPELVRRQAQQRLWLPPEPVRHRGELWQVLGLNADGSLVLGLGERRDALHRPF